MSRSVVQVVNHRSQKTSSGPSIPSYTPSYTPSFTPSYTASSLVQTGRPQTQTRSHQTTTTTSIHTSTVSSMAKPTTVTTSSTVVNNRSNTSKPYVPTVSTTTKTTTSQVVVNQRSNSKPTTTQVVSKTTSQGGSKPTSQVASKKVEVKKVTTSGDGSEIQEAFELFDSNDGKLNVREVRDAMLNIGYDEKNPVVYEVMTELDNTRSKNAGGATFNDFCQTVNYRVPEKESIEDLRNVFNLFLDDPNSDSTTLESIKRVADELGENIEEVELNAMLNKASKSGAKLTFDDFVAIMTGKEL